MNNQPNFAQLIDNLEQDLEAIYQENLKLNPNDSEQQARVFIDAMIQKVKQLIKTIPEEQKPSFEQHIKKRFGLNDEGKVFEFIDSAPSKMEKLISETFNL